MRRLRELKSRLLDFIEGSSIRTKRMEVGNLSGSTGSIMWEIGKTAIATEKEFGPIDEETATTDSGSRAEEKATASISQREGSIMEISWISKRTGGGERSCLTETIIKEASKMEYHKEKECISGQMVLATKASTFMASETEKASSVP
jgi:hypothetical protein